MVTVLPGPPSTMVMLVPAVRTRSSVRVPSVANVTYWALVGAPPPAAGAEIRICPFDCDMMVTFEPASRKLRP